MSPPHNFYRSASSLRLLLPVRYSLRFRERSTFLLRSTSDFEVRYSVLAIQKEMRDYFIKSPLDVNIRLLVSAVNFRSA